MQGYYNLANGLLKELCCFRAALEFCLSRKCKRGAVESPMLVFSMSDLTASSTTQQAY